MSKEIKLTRGLVAIVDDEDYDFLSQRKWTAMPVRDGFYAYNKIGLMHRIVMKAPKGTQVDHADGNKLDNRKSNLRFCTASQNLYNRKTPKSNRLGFTGVCERKNEHRFTAYIHANKVRYWLGSFATAIEAALARDKKAKELHGEFANLNFPDGLK
jgi:hypothetical protein